MKKVTIACMDFCGQGVTRYGIYRAILHEGKWPHVDLNDSRTRQVYEVVKQSAEVPRFSAAGSELSKFYFEMAEPHGTAEYPAFAFNYR